MLRLLIWWILRWLWPDRAVRRIDRLAAVRLPPSVGRFPEPNRLEANCTTAVSFRAGNLEEIAWCELRPSGATRLYRIVLVPDGAPRSAPGGVRLRAKDAKWYATQTQPSAKLIEVGTQTHLFDLTGTRSDIPPQDRSASRAFVAAIEEASQPVKAVLTAAHQYLQATYLDSAVQTTPWPGTVPLPSHAESLIAVDLEAGARGQEATTVTWSQVRELALVWWYPGDQELRHLSLDARNTNIEDAEVVLSHVMREAAPDRIIGHNLEAWDLPLLRRLLPTISWPQTADTLRLSRMIQPEANSHSLDSLRMAGKVPRLPSTGAGNRTHSALVDATETLFLYAAQLAELHSMPAIYQRLVRHRLLHQGNCPTLAEIGDFLAHNLRTWSEPGVLEETLTWCYFGNDSAQVVRTRLIESNWMPTRASLAAEVKALEQRGKSQGSTGIARLLIVPTPPVDSIYSWSPKQTRFCLKKIWDSDARAKRADLDVVWALALRTASADVRRVPGLLLNPTYRDQVEKLCDYPDEGCQSCALAASNRCAVCRSTRAEASPATLTCVSPEDAPVWLAPRPLSGPTIPCWFWPARTQTRRNLDGFALRWRQDALAKWPALDEEIRNALSNSGGKALASSQFDDVVRAAQFRQPCPIELRPVPEAVRPPPSADKLGVASLGSVREVDDGALELQLRSSSPGAALSAVHPAAQTELLLDRRLRFPSAVDSVPEALPLAISYRCDPRTPTMGSPPRSFPPLGVYAGALLPARGPLAAPIAARETIAAGLAASRQGARKVVLALSIPIELWPDLQTVARKPLDGWPLVFDGTGPHGRRARADFLLNDYADGALLLVSAHWLLGHPEALSIRDADGESHLSVDLILLDRVPYDLTEEHRIESLRFHQLDLGPDAIRWSYRHDVRWPLAILQLQAFVEHSAAHVVLLDKRAVSGLASRPLSAVFRLRKWRDAPSQQDSLCVSGDYQAALDLLAPERDAADTDLLIERSRTLMQVIWRHDQFRTCPDFTGNIPISQADILRCVYENHDCLAVLPTGLGKSLTFQLPALVAEDDFFPGLTLVISPLIALMQDQVRNLHSRGIHSVAALNSDLAAQERQLLLERVANGTVNLLYCSPEQLRGSAIRKAAADRELTLLVVDEAHCVSQWGHDFRTDYLFIADFAETVISSGKRRFPILALTATARLARSAEEGDTVGDIRERLHFHRSGESYIGASRRSDLQLTIIDVHDKYDLAPHGAAPKSSSKEVNPVKLRVIADHLHGKSEPHLQGKGLIYCAYKSHVEQIAEALSKDAGREVRSYSGGLSSFERSEALEWFAQKGENRVMVATSAFGMGVDVEDIQFVAHWDLPFSLEDYYQQVGRAARRPDLLGHGLMLYDLKDERKPRLLWSRSEVDEGMIHHAWYRLAQAALGRDKDGYFLLDATELERAAGASPDGNIGALILYYFEHFIRHQGRPLVKRWENVAATWTVRLAKGQRAGSHPSEGAADAVLFALRSDGCPFAHHDSNGNLTIELNPAREHLGLRMDDLRRALITLAQRRYLEIVTKAHVTAKADHKTFQRNFEKRWRRFEDLVRSAYDASRDNPDLLSVPHDPLVRPDQFINLFSLVEEVQGKRRLERARLRQMRLVRADQPWKAPTQPRAKYLKATCALLQSVLETWVPSHAGERVSLNLDQLLVGNGSKPSAPDQVLQAMRHRDRCLAILASWGDIQLGGELGSASARLQWLQREVPDIKELDTKPMQRRLHEVRQLTNRKLRLIHHIASKTSSEEVARYISDYFRGDIPLDNPQERKDWSSRIRRIGDNDLSPDQLALCLTLPASNGAVIEGLGGTGKTEIIARRYLALKYLYDLDEGKILLLSANNASLGYLQQRIIDLSDGRCRVPQQRTVSGLGHRILMQFGRHLPFPAPEGLDNDACEQQLDRLIRQYGHPSEAVPGARREITRALLSGQYPGSRWESWIQMGRVNFSSAGFQEVRYKDRRGDWSSIPSEVLVDIARAFDDWKCEQRVFDYDDQLHIGAALLSHLESQGLLPLVRLGWTHVLIDEAQDISTVAARLIKTVFPKSALFIALDSYQTLRLEGRDLIKQSTSRWLPEEKGDLYEQRDTEFRGLRANQVVRATLRRNYRQPNHIMAVAVWALGVDPAHVPEAPSGRQVELAESVASAQDVAKLVLSLVAGGETKPSDLCVIANSKERARSIQQAIASLSGRRTRTSLGSREFLESSEALAWARIALLKAGTKFPQELGDDINIAAVLARLVQQGLPRDCSARERALVQETLVRDSDVQHLGRRTVRLLPETQQDVLQRILGLGQYDGKRLDDSTEELVEQWRVNQFSISDTELETKEAFYKEARAIAKASLSEGLHYLWDHLPEASSASSQDIVQVTYPHESKGGEFPTVVCTWEYFPSGRTPNAEMYRRQLYVAMGRAKDRLILAGSPLSTALRDWRGRSVHCTEYV